MYWDNLEETVGEQTQNAWVEVTWQGHHLDVLVMHWNDNVSADRHYSILADSKEIAVAFFTAVCTWNTAPHGDVLVFESGSWSKDKHLLEAIKGASFDNLILRQDLKEQILGDARRFFAAQATYETYGVPWKRGILFAGPPGNGKTHAAKALVNALGRPCLYVKSFRQAKSPDEYGMRSVFERARISAPCILVLEDLDALITSHNRSFFLNEMDGFAVNKGILTVATTNHPEGLDPAIVQRPSRFDRTYRFELPGVRERDAYIAFSNNSLQPEMQLCAESTRSIAEQTEGFSFAYLKELFLSTMVRWMDTPVAEGLGGIMHEHVALLRDQMSAVAPSTTEDGEEGSTDDD